MARRGAFRAFAAGTAIAGLMGVGAVCVARSYGITSVQQSGAMLKRTPQQGPPHCTHRLRASALYVQATRAGLLGRMAAWPGGRYDCARTICAPG